MQKSLEHSFALESVFVSRFSQIIVAGILGVSLFLAVGFLPVEAVHNAAHDTRHANAFPCH